MSFRQASIVVAVLYVLAHSNLIYAHSVSWQIWRDMREIVDIFAIISLCIALAGGSIWFVAAAMLLATVWISPMISQIVPLMIQGLWNYSWRDAGIFSLMFLPPISLAAALLADGRWRYLSTHPAAIDEQA